MLLEDNDVIEIGDIRFRVIHTFWHTPGSVCLYADKIVFTGDTLMHRGIGTTFTSGGNRSQLIEIGLKKGSFSNQRYQ
jgi:hydroxyacylglutathione hydrolase